MPPLPQRDAGVDLPGFDRPIDQPTGFDLPIDNAIDPPVDPIVDAPPFEAPTGPCNEVTGTGCAYPNKCGLSCSTRTLTCIPAGSMGLGEACSYETDCQQGLSCTCTTASTCTCRRYCRFDTDCYPSTCSIDVACSGDPAGTSRAKICSDAPCDPVFQDCPSGQRCIYVCGGTMPRTFQCVTDDGTRTHGQPCDEGLAGTHCARGHACVSGFPGTSGLTCLRYCASDFDCPAGRVCTTMGPSCSGQAASARLCSY